MNSRDDEPSGNQEVEIGKMYFGDHVGVCCDVKVECTPQSNVCALNRARRHGRRETDSGGRLPPR